MRTETPPADLAGHTGLLGYVVGILRRKYDRLSEADWDDVAQELFFTLDRARTNYADRGAAWSTYAIKSMLLAGRGLVADALRKRKRWALRAQREIPFSVVSPALVRGRHRLLARDDAALLAADGPDGDAARLLACVGQLQKRQLYVVRHLNGIGCRPYSTDEIARRLSVTRQRVHQLHQIAIRNIREMMAAPADRCPRGRGHYRGGHAPHRLPG